MMVVMIEAEVRRICVNKSCVRLSSDMRRTWRGTNLGGVEQVVEELCPLWALGVEVGFECVGGEEHMGGLSTGFPGMGLLTRH